jgi:hypothetical protein
MLQPFNQRLLELPSFEHKEFLEWLDHPGAIHFRRHLESKVNYHALKATSLALEAETHPRMESTSAEQMKIALQYKSILTMWDEVVKDKKPQILA